MAKQAMLQVDCVRTFGKVRYLDQDIGAVGQAATGVLIALARIEADGAGCAKTLARDAFNLVRTELGRRGAKHVIHRINPFCLARSAGDVSVANRDGATLDSV